MQNPGRVRHVDIKELCVQQLVRMKKAFIGKDDTATNWADIGTKPLNCLNKRRCFLMVVGGALSSR